MDYETADGSQFSLREVWTQRDNGFTFDYTTVSAQVAGSAYVGKLSQRVDDVDEADASSVLEPVPLSAIHPLFPVNYTVAPPFDPAEHYLKAPSYTWDDCRPGKTLVADCVLNEVNVLERLTRNQHTNIVNYYGCVVKGGLILQTCLQRYPSRLTDHEFFDQPEAQLMFNGIRAGIEHLHSLGLAHNDVNPDNICIDARGNPIIIDFDSCLPFGRTLLKGVGFVRDASGHLISSKENDYHGLDDLEDIIFSRIQHG